MFTDRLVGDRVEERVSRGVLLVPCGFLYLKFTKSYEKNHNTYLYVSTMP
jgi:hypothetical protein